MSRSYDLGRPRTGASKGLRGLKRERRRRITHPRARARAISSKNSVYSDFTGRLAWKRERLFSTNERAPPARYVVIGSPQNTTCTERGEISRSRPGRCAENKDGRFSANDI